MNNTKVTPVSLPANPSHPTIIRTKLGPYTIEASPVGDGIMGAVVQGPPADIAAMANLCRAAGMYVEADDREPDVLYVQVASPMTTAKVDEEDEPTRRYRVRRSSGAIRIVEVMA